MSQATFRPETGEKLPHIRSKCVIALGTNQSNGQGDLREILHDAVSCIARDVGVIRATSRHFRTAAFPAGSGPDFVNAAVAVESGLGPMAILEKLHDIEALFSRDRSTRWGQRTLDLDLLAVGDQVLPDTGTYKMWADLPIEVQMSTAPDGLILPHPRLHERGFVLIPMLDVAPDWVHPVLGMSVAEMCAALPKVAKDDVEAL
ncbi:MAG: 2-amino-4-hydroxy-6-hydroxymethyldihydropteridine diphosphokinase [Roseobacter sp.]